MMDTLDVYRPASTCCRIPGCFAAATEEMHDGSLAYCAHHGPWHCPQCEREGRFAEADRQYDRFGIYCGRMCDACYQASSYATYEPEEPIEEDPSCFGAEFRRGDA